MKGLDPTVAWAVAKIAVHARQRSSDGNIGVINLVRALRVLGEHTVGAQEFNRWMNWHAPETVVLTRALEGGEPG